MLWKIFPLNLIRNCDSLSSSIIKRPVRTFHKQKDNYYYLIFHGLKSIWNRLVSSKSFKIMLLHPYNQIETKYFHCHMSILALLERADAINMMIVSKKKLNPWNSFRPPIHTLTIQHYMCIQLQICTDAQTYKYILF